MSKGPCDYIELPNLPPHFRVADVGPGRYPLRRADVFIDAHEGPLANVPEGRETLLADITGGFPMIGDKAFDYVWCSHVMEHLDDPAAAAATLSRIAKAGTMVVPSAVKEAMFNFEEAEHQWLILPHPQTNIPIFIRHNKRFIERIKDRDIMKVACQMFRTGTGHDMWEHEYCRYWFSQREPDLDITVHWSGSLEIQVIG